MRQPIPFGKYLLLERISVGGMAEVFKAKSFGVEGFEKIIAIKRILPTMVEDADFIQMFIDEAKIAGQLSHANICQIFELGKIAESHFIAMEFIWGKDLLQIQNRFRKLRQQMPVAMAAFVAAKMCEGLDYAHKKKDARGAPLLVVHRDVSPQNILVSYEGEIKLIDFGIAKAATRSSKTQAGVLKGKFGYMSPEQVRGLPLDRRSDLFALGTILYELLTGERLFLGESDFSTLERVRNVDISPPSRHNRNVPPALEKIVMKSLAKEPEDRYQWANELQEELLQFVMGIQPVFTAKQLSAWMKEAFSPELARERQLLEQYKKLGRDGIIAGKAAAENQMSVVEGLGKAAPPDDGAEQTAKGGPNFEDVLDDALASSSDPPTEPLAPPKRSEARPASSAKVATPSGLRVSKGGAQGFGDEGPTEIFGEVESRLPAAVPPHIGAESTVILPGGSSAGAVPTPPSSAPSPRAIAGVSAASMSSRMSPPSGAAAISRVPTPQPQLAVSPASLAAALPASLAAAPALPAQPASFGAAMGLGSAAAGASLSAFGGLPAGGEVGHMTAPVASLPFLSPARRRLLLRDVGIAAGVAVLVLGLIVGGRFLFGGSRHAPAAVIAATGTIVVAAADNGVGEVFVNDGRRGELVAGSDPLTLEGLAPGEYVITVKRPGVPDFVQKVMLDGRHTEVVFCRFEPAAVAQGKLVLHFETEGVTVLVDNQEISAEAAHEPLELAPRVEHTITLQREGFVPQTLLVVLAAGQLLERDIELVAIDSGKSKSRDRRAGGEARKPVEVPVVDAGVPTTDEDVGYLIANTTPYARVLIDDKDTGKMTPIAPRAKIPLKPGKHTVTFVVGEDSFNYPIMIEAGRDHRLIKTLPVE